MALAKEALLVNHAAGADLSVAEEVATMLDVECSGYPGRECFNGGLRSGG